MMETMTVGSAKPKRRSGSDRPRTHHLAGIVAVLIAATQGCATPRAMSKSEWDSSLTRQFSDVTTDQVIAAARTVFELTDPADFQIVPTEHGIQATREWSWFLLIAATRGWDTWQLSTKQAGTGVEARVHLSVVTSDTNTFIAGTAAVPVTSSSQTAAFAGTAIYDVFWARVEYLLGKRADWMTCAESNSRVESGVVWGQNEPLCDSLTTTDPPAPPAMLKP